MQASSKGAETSAAGSPGLYVVIGAAVVIAATFGTITLHGIIERIATTETRDTGAHIQADTLVYVLAALSVVFIELLLVLLYRVGKRQVRQVERVAEHGMQEQAELFRAVLENSPVAIFAVDKEGILRLRKGRGGSRAGVKPDQGIGISYFEQFPDVPKHLENVRRALKGETISDKLPVRDGHYAIVYAPIRDASSAIDGMVGVATDITEQERAEEQLKELGVLKNTFITVVSHQLRTPLSAVRWNLEAIINEDLGKLKKEQKEFLRVTYAANGEVITRINDLLLAMDIEEGRAHASLAPVSVASIWQSVMIEVKKRCDLKELTCTYVPPDGELPAVEADAEKLRTAFEKLAENAVQYTEKGSITARLSAAPGAVRFEIEDTGIGISKSDQDKIFRRFYRASNALHARTDASGLGLYIAKHFIEGHGGRIGFESEEGRGSTFWFEIPVK